MIMKRQDWTSRVVGILFSVMVLAAAASLGQDLSIKEMAYASSIPCCTPTALFTNVNYCLKPHLYQVHLAY